MNNKDIQGFETGFETYIFHLSPERLNEIISDLNTKYNELYKDDSLVKEAKDLRLIITRLEERVKAIQN